MLSLVKFIKSVIDGLNDFFVSDWLRFRRWRSILVDRLVVFFGVVGANCHFLLPVVLFSMAIISRCSGESKRATRPFKRGQRGWKGASTNLGKNILRTENK